ncbi:ester cyclase [Nocardia sp. NPDC050406]|uniref:ester cyclase n=1 Tax=Nocardia sp. NPDC050406 TaxID=3364318 RepID=UPI00378BC7C1
MDAGRMFELARELAVVKSRQDVAGALRLLHPNMVLESPAFGSVVRGHAANDAALRWFFATFPDYDVELRGHAANDETLSCWGTVRMTLTDSGLGVTPNGRRAEVPVSIRFTFADDLIASEYFFFDLSELCAQSGVSTDEVRRKLFGDRR